MIRSTVENGSNGWEKDTARLSKLYSRKSAIAVSVSIFIYVLLFVALKTYFGRGEAIATVIPVCTIAWFFGLKVAVWAALISLPVNVWLYVLTGVGWEKMIYQGGIQGTIGLVIIGAVVGRLHDLRILLRKELTERDKAEKELKFHHDNLDKLVRDKTAELRAINQTLRKEIEQREFIERERLKLATAVDQANDVVIIFDLEGVVQYGNPAVEYHLGYTPGQIIGRNLDVFDRDAERKDLFQEAWNTIKKGDIWSGHIRARSKDNSIRNLDVTISPIRDAAEDVTGFVSIARNVTKEIELKERLLRSEKMEAIGTLASGVAHDLNNTLGAIVGYPELLLREIPEDSPLRRPIIAIKQSGEQAAAIVRDLLALARRGVEQGRDVIHLNAVISDLLLTLEYKKFMELHPGVRVEINLANDLMNIEGSAIKLSKSIMNLLTNGAEAMPGGGKIEISTENVYLDRPLEGYATIDEGEYVVLGVSDSGTGIVVEDFEMIFEPFFSRKDMGISGTGLGMAVVWGTVKDHNGYIDLVSEEGKGTTFKLYFPITREAIKNHEKPVPLADYMGGGEKILVIDDVEAQRNIASNLLGQLKYSVVTVASGEEAVEYLKTHSVDLLLLDMIMNPGIDGLETYRRILEICPGQKAIIASGFSETDRVMKAQELGAGSYVSKPYTLETIGLAVKAQLKKMS